MAPFTGVLNTDLQKYGPTPNQGLQSAVPIRDAQTLAQSEQLRFTTGEVLGYGFLGLGIGLYDTLGQSVGLHGDNTVSETLQKYSAPGGLGDFYARNQTALRAGGEIVGIALPGMIALKGLRAVRWARESGKLGGFLKNSASAEAILGSATRLTAAEQNLSRLASTTKASFGTFSGKTFNNPAINVAKRSYYGQRVIETARQTAAFELAYRGLYGDSEFFYPADYTLTDELKWAGAGFGIGAGIDFAIGRFAVRQLIKGALASAPATASEAGLRNFANLASQGIDRPGERGARVTYLARLKELTEGAMTDAANPALTTNLRTDLAVIDKEMSTIIADMARDKHAIVSQTFLSPERSKLAVEALSQNPTSLLYATKIGDVPENAGKFYAAQEQEITRLQAFMQRLQTRETKLATKKPSTRVKDPSERARFAAEFSEKAADTAARRVEVKAEYDAFQAAAKEQHYVIESWGAITPYHTRADNWLDTHEFSAIRRTAWTATEADTKLAGGQVSVKHSRLELENMQLDDNFIFTGADVSKLNPDGWSKVHAMTSKMISEWKPVTNQIFVLNEKTPWLQMESILTLGRKNQDAASRIKLAGKFQTLKDAEFFVADQKYKEYLKRLPQIERQPRGTKSILDKAKFSPEQFIDMFNLPRSEGVRPNAMMELFAQAKVQGAKSLDEIFRKANELTPTDHPLDLLHAAMREAINLDDPKVLMTTAGKLMEQTGVKPLFVASEAVPTLSWADSVIHARVLATQENAIAALGKIDPRVAPIAAATIQQTAKTAAISAAKDVMSLHDAVASGRGVAVSQDRINDQYEALKAMHLLAQDTDRSILKAVGLLFDENLTRQMSELRHKKNYNHLVDANRIEHSYRHGWDIDRVEFDADGVSARFVLNSESKLNNQLYQRYFKKDLPTDVVTYMPDMSITARRAGEVALRTSRLSAEMMQTTSDLSLRSGRENNALRVATGKNPIKLRKFHLPTPDLAAEEAWFVRNSAGEVIDMYARGTEAQNKARALDAVAKLSATSKEPHVAVSYESTKLEHSMDDVHFLDFVNYSDQWRKTGAGTTGGMAQAEIDRTDVTIQNMVRTLSQQFINVGVRSRAALFEPQLRYAREASMMTGAAAGLQKSENNIFDRYIATMFSRSTQSGTGYLSRGYRLAENTYDNMMSYMYAIKSEQSALSPASTEAAKGLKRLIQSNVTESEFKQYQKAAEQWSPFQNITDWLESTHREVPLQTARSHAVALSKASATMSLRFADVGTAILNFSGLLTNALPVVSALRPTAWRSREDWVANTAAWGTKLGSGDTVTFSPVKALTTTIHNFWSGKYSVAMEKAAKEGLFDPEYAMISKALSAPQTGDKRWFERWVDAASYAADRSEYLSRKLAWGMGYDIGKQLHKFDDDRNAFIFANNFMNNMIGNYNPRNKPGMFQGAVGLPLGAFQTYMFNFYRRMYGYLERKDWRTMAAAYGMQASVFGSQSVPGWSLFNNYLLTDYDGTDNLVTRMDRQFPPGVGELLLHGSLSGIPAIFGADAPAFYPRGSVDMTQIPANPTDYGRAPPIQFLATTMQGVKKTIDNFVEGFSLQKQEEIFANFTTNRSLKFIMEAAAGAKTDRVGQIVDNETRNWLHIASAMVGTVPASAKRLQDTYNAQQLVEVNQANARSKLNDKTRSMLRGGEFGVSDMQGMLSDYVRSGGNPAYFGQWLRNITETAFYPKADRKLMELSRGADWLEFTNMMASMQQSGGQE